MVSALRAVFQLQQMGQLQVEASGYIASDEATGKSAFCLYPGLERCLTWFLVDVRVHHDHVELQWSLSYCCHTVPFFNILVYLTFRPA